MWKLSVIADAAFCAANPVQQQPWHQRGRGRGSRNQFDSYAHIICITLFAHPPSALNFQIPNKSASEMLFHAFHPAVFALSFTFSFTLHSGSASCVSGCQSPALSSSLSLSPSLALRWLRLISTQGDSWLWQFLHLHLWLIHIWYTLASLSVYMCTCVRVCVWVTVQLAQLAYE